MKNSILTYVLTVLISTSSYAVHFPEYRGVVNDFEEVLSEKEEKTLSKIIKKNETQNGVKIILVTTKNYAPAKEFRTYIFGLFEHWKMNANNSKNGILVLASKNKKELKIIPGKNIKVILGNREVKRLVEEVMMPKFLLSKYFVGLKKGIKSMVKSIKNFNKGF